MAKRIAIFIGLTWLVIWLIPKMLPGPVRPAAQPVAAEPSAAPEISSLAGSGGGDASAVSGAGGAGAVQQPDSALRVDAPADSIRVATPLVNYIFSSRGATPVSVKLTQFRSLDGDSSIVELLRSEASLLRYRVVSGGDTISLADLNFNGQSVRDAAGNVTALTYSTAVNSLRLRIRYDFVPDSYTVRVSGQLEGLGGGALLLSQLPDGLRSNEADTLEDQRHMGVAYQPESGDSKAIPFSKLDPGEVRTEATPMTWIALKSKYFIVGMLKMEGADAFRGLRATGGARVSRMASSMSTSVVDDVSSGAFAFEVYTGPQEFRRLLAMGRGFHNSNPYGGFLQPVVQPFALIVMRILLWIKATVNVNYGWVLVIFGVTVRLLLWPLNQKAMRSSIRMQRIQPQLQAVQQQHKSNPQKQQEELMKVYREHGMTPFSPLAGCLPMMIPMPVLFALFFVFQNTIEFRGVPFLWLPDISLKDPLYIVPVLMGASMFLMSWLGQKGVPPTPQTKMFLYIFPAMFTFFFLNFASGLNLYYAVQNVAALPQQWLIANERTKAGIGGTAGAGGGGSGKGVQKSTDKERKGRPKGQNRKGD